jgi:hypothetical protein
MANYGSPEGVAALAKTWTDAGEFKDPDLYGLGGTPTTLSEVVSWLEELSSFMDAALAEQGFAVPVDPSDYPAVARMLDLKVNALVADLVQFAHSKGRLLSDRIQQSGESSSTVLEREILSWVKSRINALEGFGIPRIVDLEANQAYSIQPRRQL